ncbi:MAG: hypothetical protein M1429_03140 [Patescibacteria group bacterium]|nr:hypothetical protein [Patescibacteria group bacterium]
MQKTHVIFMHSKDLTEKQVTVIDDRLAGFVANILSSSSVCKINKSNIRVYKWNWDCNAMMMAMRANFILRDIVHSEQIPDIDFMIVIFAPAMICQYGFSDIGSKIAFFLKGAIKEADPEAELPIGLVEVSHSDFSFGFIN